MCVREGCPRRANKDHPTCSLLCRVMVDKLAETERLCHRLGDTEKSRELWLAAVALNDALSEYLRAFSWANRAARRAAGDLLAV